MQIIRYRDGGVARLGIVEAGQVRAAGGELFGPLLPREQIGALGEFTLLPPVAPGKIVAVGLNYHDHVGKVSERSIPSTPLLSMKPPSSLIGQREAIVIPQGADPVYHEAELAVVIGRRARHVRREQAGNYILGFTCANDVTARNFQHDDGQWVRAKGFDTFCPLGPMLVTDLDAGALAIEAQVNGVQRQASDTSRLIFDVPALIAFISGVMTLLPGDVILTGTPAGAGPIVPGDVVEVMIASIGTLTNTVIAEDRS